MSWPRRLSEAPNSRSTGHRLESSRIWPQRLSLAGEEAGSRPFLVIL